MKIKYAILLTAIFAATAFAQTEPKDTDGNGFRNISTLDHLRWLSENDDHWDDNYELDNDINAADTKNWNDGKGFSPIGNDTVKFTGKFNGNGYAIVSPYISRENQNYVGFFGYTSGTEIKNIGIINCDISGKHSVGALVSWNQGSKISNSYSKGSVNGYKHVGGLVGLNAESKISNSYSKGIVNGYEYVGGLVGDNLISIISNCYSKGSVCTGSISDYRLNIGGLVGRNDSSTIKNSYSTDSVNGDYHIGGLVGTNLKSTIINSYSTGFVSGYQGIGGLVGSNSSRISNCYSKGSVNGYEFVGGLVGQKYPSSSVSNSFWDIETSGQSTSDGGTGKSTQEMKTKTTFTDAGWDFDSTWSINKDINEGYPFLLPDSVNTSVVEFNKTDHNPKVYPNPVYNSFSINSDEEIISVEVFDPEGKLVMSFDRNMTSYNISSLNSGFYFVKVNYRKKYQLVKIVKG